MIFDIFVSRLLALSLSIEIIIAIANWIVLVGRHQIFFITRTRTIKKANWTNSENAIAMLWFALCLSMFYFCFNWTWSINHNWFQCSKLDLAHVNANRLGIRVSHRARTLSTITPTINILINYFRCLLFSFISISLPFSHLHFLHSCVQLVRFAFWFLNVFMEHAYMNENLKKNYDYCFSNIQIDELPLPLQQSNKSSIYQIFLWMFSRKTTKYENRLVGDKTKRKKNS